MFPHLVIAASALLVSGLTLFSGFGLGTLLMPVFALFFPVEVAVAATALVHGANNVLKAGLLGRDADLGVVLRFGLPAVLAAFGGAATLGLLSHLPVLFRYHILSMQAEVSPLKLVMAGLMLFFAAMEVVPALRDARFPRALLPLGGMLSGFFGGLSGHQGAMRSAFLARSGLDTAAFLGTNAVIGLSVDLARTMVYGAWFAGAGRQILNAQVLPLVATGVFAAFAGVVLGKRMVHKVTMRGVQRLTAALLLLLALLLGSGLI